MRKKKYESTAMKNYFFNEKPVKVAFFGKRKNTFQQKAGFINKHLHSPFAYCIIAK